MAPSAIPPLMSSNEVNLLVYGYLGESSLSHSAFTLYSESRLADFVGAGEDNAPTGPPTGQLIRILQKGLLYLQAEAKYRGEDVAANPPRLVGYTIPDALPLPALPKTLPPASPPPTASTATNNGRKKQGPISNAAAGPSGSLKRKEKDVSNNGSSNGGDDHASTSQQQQHQQAKKQRTNKSPTGAANNTDDAMSIASNNTADEGVAEGNTASLSAAQAAKNRKGKGKAVDGNGDSEMANASSTTAVTSEKTTTSAATPAQAPAKGTLAKALASAASAASKVLPSALKDKDNPPSARRSTSPIVSRKTSSTKDGSRAPGEKNRPRSTSPSTSFRQTVNAASAASGSSMTAKTTAALSTPTLDSSKQSLPSTSKAANPSSEQPIPQPSNILTGKAVQVLKGHTMPVQPCHWNPKVANLLATGSGDSTMRIWDVPISKKGEEEVVEPLSTGKHSSGQRRADVTAVAWNHEGTLLATGSEDGIARIWTPSGDLLYVLSMHQRTIFSVRWNSSGTMLLTGSLDHSICLWDTGYAKLRQQWTSHTDSVLDLDWLTDEVFASCSMDKNINIHQAGRANVAYRFKGHTDEVNCIRFDPGKRLLASCSDDNTVRIWSLKAVKGILGLKDEEVKNEIPEDGEIAASDPASQEDEPNFLVLRGHKKEVHAVSWCPKKDAEGSMKILASASFDSTARLWDASNGNCLHIINRHSDMVYSLAWQPEFGNYLATGSNDNKMCVTRTASSNKAEQYELCHEFEHSGAVYEISWHPTRNQIAVCGKANVVNVVNFDIQD